MLDDRAPHPHLGAGFPRAYDILRLLVTMGHDVEFVPCSAVESPGDAARAIPHRFGYRAPGTDRASITRFVEARAREYDVLWVSRPGNMAMLQRDLPPGHPVWDTYPLVVYDAEAIFSLRTALQRRYYPGTSSRMTIERELGMAQVADVVAVVNRTEGRYFEERGKRTVVLGSCYRAVPEPPVFDRTRGFLFVGAMHGLGSPNVDALAWFCRFVAPLLRSRLGAEFHLDVAGIMSGVKLSMSPGDDVRLLGMVPDLSQAYAGHRVFIAPHRIAAGIPIKVLEASAHGTPVVATTLLAEQLGWRHGRELFAVEADDPEAFADACLAAYTDDQAWRQVQAGARRCIASDFSEDVFGDAIATVLASRRD